VVGVASDRAAEPAVCQLDAGTLVDAETILTQSRYRRCRGVTLPWHAGLGVPVVQSALGVLIVSGPAGSV